MNIIQEMPATLTQVMMPEKTETYTPVQHAALVKYLYNKLESSGYTVDKATFSSDANGNKMVGTMRIGMGNADFGMSLGFRNSYDKSMSLGVGVGATVFVCNNGMFLADVQQLRKHTANVGKDLNSIVNTQIDYIGEMFDKYAEDVEILKSKEIHRSTMNEIVGGMFMEQKIITGAQLSIIRKEVSMSENFRMLGSGGSMSLWNLYNNTTEALKKSHVTRYFKDHSQVHNLMLDYA